MNLERRTVTQPIEFREEGDKLVATGLGIVYEKRSQNLGGFQEVVRPGAAKKTILEADVRGLLNHDPNLLLGRKGAGTLRLEETPEGVRYEIDLPNTTAGRDAAELLRRGDLIGSSMGFRAIGDEWGETEDGFPLRTLTEIALRDIGPVTFPAYTDTDATLGSLANADNGAGKCRRAAGSVVIDDDWFSDHGAFWHVDDGGCLILGVVLREDVRFGNVVHPVAGDRGAGTA